MAATFEQTTTAFGDQMGWNREERDSSEHAYSPEMLADLARSGLDVKDAELMRLRDWTAAQCEERCTRKVALGRAGYESPYFDLDGKPNGFSRVRFLGDPQDDSNGFVAKDKRKAPKYWQPPGTSPGLYLFPGLDWRSVLATNGPLILVEGLKKSAKACKHGKHCIGLDGVWSWKSKSTEQFFILDEIKALNLKGRDAIIIFDSDLATKPQILGALHEFARQLSNLGARVRTIILPSDGADKMGLDDLIVAKGIEAFDALQPEKFPEIEALWKFNSEFAVIRDPVAILDLPSGKLLDRGKFTGLRAANCKVVRYTAKGDPRPVSAAAEWLEWPARREHSRLVYEPGQPELLEDGEYNTWRPGSKPRSGDASAWLALVEHLFRGKPDVMREWFLRWCAFPTQHPGAKLYSASVFFGRTQGSGKSLLGEMLCGVYGPNNSVEIDKRTLAGNFNSWSAQKQFILANEIADRKDLRLDADILKSMISRERVVVNNKYQPEYSVRDCCNFFFTSNHYDAIYAEGEDRRFFFVNVEGKLPVEISRELHSWKDWPVGKYKNGEGFGPLHQFLLNLDLGDFDPAAEAYQSPDRETAINAGRSDRDAWCQDLKAAPMPFLRGGSENFRERDLWTIDELASAYKAQRNESVSRKALSNSLHKAGFRQTERVTTKKYGQPHLWVLCNDERWRDATTAELATAYETSRPKGSKY